MKLSHIVTVVGVVLLIFLFGFRTGSDSDDGSIASVAKQMTTEVGKDADAVQSAIAGSTDQDAAPAAASTAPAAPAAPAADSTAPAAPAAPAAQVDQAQATPSAG